MIERRGANVNRWVFKKEISVGNLLAIASVVGGLTAAYFSLDKRVALIEEAVAKEEVRFNRMEDNINWLVRQRHERTDGR